MSAKSKQELAHQFLLLACIAFLQIRSLPGGDPRHRKRDADAYGGRPASASALPNFTLALPCRRCTP